MSRTAPARAVPATLDTRKSFLVLFFKKEQRKQALLFEKRSKNFCELACRVAIGQPPVAGSGGLA
jgi:hypothetical protein